MKVALPISLFMWYLLIMLTRGSWEILNATLNPF